MLGGVAMWSRSSRWLRACLAVGLLSVGVGHDGTVTAQPDEVLAVAAFEVEPFVVRTGDVPGGFLFEVWE